MLPWQMAARMTGAKLVYLDCEKMEHFQMKHWQQVLMSILK